MQSLIRWRVHLFLLIVVMILTVLVVLRPGKEEIVKPALVSGDVSGLEALTLENGEHIVFEKKAGEWTLVQPFKAKVNQVRVEQLLSIPKMVPAATYPLPEAAALKNYGLDEPFARLAIAGTLLEFGGTAPLDRRRYVRDAERLYLIDDSFSHQLAAKATDFVDKKLIPDGVTIKKLEIPGLKLSKTVEGEWTSEPSKTPDRLQDLVMQWSTARAIEIRRGAPKVLGEKIEIGTATGDYRFSILQKTPELILGREDLDLVFVMTAEASKALLNLSIPAVRNIEAQSIEGGEDEDPEHGESEDAHLHE